MRQNKERNIKRAAWLAVPAFLFLTSAEPALRAEETPKRHPTLEEMSPEQFRAALKKSHAEIQSRLGDNGMSESSADAKNKTSSLSEKNAYITSAQSRIDMLNYKIDSLQNHYYDNWGYAQKDAAKLRSIQSRAREELNKIRRIGNDGWKNNRRALEGILREASTY